MLTLAHLLHLISCFIIMTVGLQWNDELLDSGSEDLLLYEGSDFLITATSRLFVDRTLLIKSFFDITKRGNGLLIQTPSKYGKSTNFNMIKRFFSLSINERGCIQDPRQTSNYLVFKNNHLRIYENKHFFNSHFGKYPVMYIDFEPLSQLNDISDFCEVLGQIFLQTTEDHQYLNGEMKLLAENISNTFVDKELSKYSNEIYLKTSFVMLARYIYNKCKQRVIILIDNFDAFVESPFYSKNSNVLHLMKSLYHGLLECESVERSLVTGVIRTSQPPVDVLPSCVVASGKEHGVWPYYGLSGKELDDLLQPIVPNMQERETVMAMVVHEYSRETFGGGKDIQHTQISSVWAVIQYLHSGGANNNFDYVEYSLD